MVGYAADRERDVKVQGVGGVFIRARDVEAMSAWYSLHLGLPLQSWGDSRGVEFPSADVDPGDRVSSTVFSILPHEGQLPTERPLQLNFRVADLDAAIVSLSSSGVVVETDESQNDYGRFAWVTDPEGNRLELWEPPPAE